MNVRLLRAAILWALALPTGDLVSSSEAGDLYLADGGAWPGRIMLVRDGHAELWFARGERVAEGAVPRIQSLTVLPSGRIVFVSGLDRMLFEIATGGERVVQRGGYLARQVRTGSDGRLYWSGLETPQDGAPLPDGFIYSWDPATNTQRVELTFSQGDVGRDWWGAFDVRDGMLYVGTLAEPARIYDFATPLPRLVATLPIRVSAFRFAADGSLWAADGQGTLFRFADLGQTEKPEVILDSDTAFVDFAFPAQPRR